MDKKNLQQIHHSLRDIYNRAQESGRKNNLDYAIKLLIDLVKKSPGLVPARQLLREYETKKSDQAGIVPKLLTPILGPMIALKIKAMINKNPLEAMKKCEEELGKYLYNPPVLDALADAAMALDANFIAVEALSVIREKFPNNEANLRKLADIFKAMNDGPNVVLIFQQLAARRPRDLKAQSELRAATAFATMAAATQTDDEGQQSDKPALKEVKAEDEIAELLGKQLHDINQLNRVIAYLEAELAKEDTFETRRKLGDYCYQAKYYDQAIAYFQSILENSETFDPAIDKYHERAVMAKYDSELASLKAQGGQEERINELENEKFQYQLERASNRVQLYPNDSQLRYELGMLDFQNNDFDGALEQFQYARKNPNRRLVSNIYMGRSLAAKGQYDMAVEQLESVVAEMPRMDKQKMEAMFYLGNVFEEMGMNDKALDIYKEIYQNDISFMDVASRIESFYAKEKEQPQQEG